MFLLLLLLIGASIHLKQAICILHDEVRSLCFLTGSSYAAVSSILRKLLQTYYTLISTNIKTICRRVMVRTPKRTLSSRWIRSRVRIPLGTSDNTSCYPYYHKIIREQRQGFEPGPLYLNRTTVNLKVILAMLTPRPGFEPGQINMNRRERPIC